MKIKSWHLALLGFLFFAIHLSSSTTANNIKCGGTYEFGASDCHNEFSGLAMVFTFVQALILAFPIVLLGVEKGARKSEVAGWWIKTVIFLDIFSLGLFLWNLLYSFPITLGGLIIIFLFDRWRRILGSIICILLSEFIMVMAFDYWGNIVGVSLSLQIVALTALLFCALMYLFAGFFFLFRENKTAKNKATLK